MRRRPARIPAAVEVCDRRTMLSGNVTAELAGGVLTIAGDRDGNVLTATIDGDAVTFASADGTTVNGQAAGDVSLPGAVSSVSFRGFAGDDRLTLRGDGDLEHVSGDVTLRGDGGDDVLNVDGLRVGGNLRIEETTLPGTPGGSDPFAGADFVAVRDVQADGVFVSGGSGGDVVTVLDSAAEGDLLVYGHDGADVLAGSGNDAGGRAAFYGGRESDRLRVAGEAADVLVRGYIELDEADRDTARDPVEADGRVVRVTDDSEDADRDALENLTSDALVRLGDLDALADDAFAAENFIDGFPAVDLSQFEESESGVFFRLLEPGTGGTPADGESVNSVFQGFQADGSEFQARGEGSFVVGPNPTSIVGFAEGLQMLGEGGRIQVLIPSRLAYGAGGSRGDLFAETLFFNLERPAAT